MSQDYKEYCPFVQAISVQPRLVLRSVIDFARVFHSRQYQSTNVANTTISDGFTLAALFITYEDYVRRRPGCLRRCLKDRYQYRDRVPATNGILKKDKKPPSESFLHWMVEARGIASITYTSTFQILPEFFAGPLFASVPQDFHGFMIHTLNALPDRSLQLVDRGSPAEVDQFRRQCRRCRSRSNTLSRGHGVDDWRRVWVVWRVAESCSPNT